MKTEKIYNCVLISPIINNLLSSKCVEHDHLIVMTFVLRGIEYRSIDWTTLEAM